MKAEDFIGLSKKAAQDRAEQKNLIFRLIRINEKNFLSYPTDTRTDRICIEIDGQTVSKASLQ